MLWYRALRHYSYAMRVDEDVCLTRMPPQTLVAALSADYAFGLETTESHRETIDTFNPWLDAHMVAAALVPTISPLPTQSIYFTNFFVSRVAWWDQVKVRRFLHEVNGTGGIYEHRWGDAPIQTAALRLHGSSDAVIHLDVDYVRPAQSSIRSGPPSGQT
jgi:hypothetical protein